MNVLDLMKLPQPVFPAGHVKRAMEAKLAAHREYICRYGDDLPEVRDWHWAGDRRDE